jgi:hypothetical protein
MHINWNWERGTLLVVGLTRHKSAHMILWRDDIDNRWDAYAKFGKLIIAQIWL